MKRRVLLVLLVLLSTTAGAALQADRSSYDPMAHERQTKQQPGIIESALAGINPQNRDYGVQVGDWRKEVLEDTLHQIYFWSLILLAMGLGISVTGNGWLLRDRERRLTISAEFIRPMGNSFNSVRDTMAHICAAERIWITRLKGEKPQGLQKPDRLPDVDAARREWAELEGEMREQLARLGPEDVERTIQYQDLRGNDQSDVLWQMLQHVVNHGTYHRGQITTMLRQLDAAPPKSMDLIAFYRERNQKA